MNSVNLNINIDKKWLCQRSWGKKNPLVSGNAGDEKILHPGGCKFFF